MVGKMRLAALLVLVLLFGAFAGCLVQDAADGDDDEAAASGPERDDLGRVVHRVRMDPGDGPSGEFLLNLTSGGLSRIALGDGFDIHTAYSVSLPSGAYVLERGRWGTNEGEATEGVIEFLVPPGWTELRLSIALMQQEPQEFTLRLERVPGALFLSGENILDLYEVHRADYRDRRPGVPNYTKAQDFYESYFRELGYEVARDPYGLTQFEGRYALESSQVANVVAYRKGTFVPERIIAFGAHYDTVPGTNEGAWDDLSGTVATLELARAFAALETGYSLIFGLWGGEESGLLGSNFWVRSNPDKVAQMTAYVNLDVFGFAWPAPLGRSDPILFSAGPDGPIADYLLAKALEVSLLAGVPKNRVMLEPVGAGQASALNNRLPGVAPFPDYAGINAQSDHTSFIAAGVPSYMVSTGDLDTALATLHKKWDTIHNLTFMMANDAAPPTSGQPEMTPDELEWGRLAVAQSFEFQMFPVFYLELMAERGEFTPPTRA